MVAKFTLYAFETDGQPPRTAQYCAVDNQRRAVEMPADDDGHDHPLRRRLRAAVRGPLSTSRDYTVKRCE